MMYSCVLVWSLQSLWIGSLYGRVASSDCYYKECFSFSGHPQITMNRRQSGCVSPKLFSSQPKPSIGQETTRERVCDFLFLHFCLLISSSKQFSFFILPLNHFKIGRPHIFVLFPEHQKLTNFFGGLFFFYFSELHDAASCWRLLSVVQSCFLAPQSNAVEN